MIGHPTSMFQPPRGGPPPQAPTNLQLYNQQNMSGVTYPVMGQPNFSRPPVMSNYQPQSHALPVPQQQPPSSGAPQTHYNQPSARPKKYPYNSDIYERQRRSEPGHNYTGDSDTSDASSYRQTRNKRMSDPAYYRTRDHSRQDLGEALLLESLNQNLRQTVDIQRVAKRKRKLKKDNFCPPS
ncbi:unnamed protein product [Mytilus coruscus]|uniref:Uncharacterized protein n=1 Tax=Mytilus coruscus TaxID=42192 RepID=A0A6J8B5G5_MYTCO|nr:unnamed protein product [Mytilus coruscus]